MLILTRRVGETVVIGNDVDVTVLGVKGNQVRLGVKAPREVSVHREEVYKRINEEPVVAARSGSHSSANGAANGNVASSNSAGRQVNGHIIRGGHDDHRTAVND